MTIGHQRQWHVGACEGLSAGGCLCRRKHRCVREWMGDCFRLVADSQVSRLQTLNMSVKLVLLAYRLSEEVAYLALRKFEALTCRCE